MFHIFLITIGNPKTGKFECGAAQPCDFAEGAGKKPDDAVIFGESARLYILTIRDTAPRSVSVQRVAHGDGEVGHGIGLVQK